MITFLLAALVFQAEPSTAHLEALAKAKNGPAIAAFVDVPSGVPSPFPMMRTNGPFGVGEKGWSALDLQGLDGDRYVVLSTPITSQDIGELLLKREGTRLKYIPEGDALGVRVHDHQIDLRFLPSRQTAEITNRFTVESTGGSGAFVFRMSPHFKVSALTTANGQSVPFRQAGGIVLAQRPVGRQVYVATYAGVVDLPQWAGSVGEKEATLTNDYWYPMIARQPSTHSVTIRAPRGWVGVGMGELQERSEAGDESITRYRMDLPVVYFSVSAAPYRVHIGEVGGRKFPVWSLRLSEDAMALQPRLYAPILDFYEKNFGKFPFSGYGALDSEAYGGGALEAYSFATWGGGLPFEDAHEPAHTWWGGILNNTYLDSFWNESFTVFSDGLYMRNVPIGNVDERRQAFVQRPTPNAGYNAAPVASAGAFAGPTAAMMGYGKGAYVLQMLEQLTGTERLIATMAEWVKVDAGKAVDWADYERVANRMLPELQLGSFFDDWLRKPGFARLQVSDVRHENGAVALQIGFEGERYRMPVEVMLQFADGKREFHTLDVRAPGTFRIPAASKPALVSVDPYLRAIRTFARDEEPASLRRALNGLRRYTDPARPDYLRGVGRQAITELPQDLNGVLIVGHPDTTPRMRSLLQSAGFAVDGDSLTYRGTTIDLRTQGALALIDLPGGGQCAVGLGTTRLRPNTGSARTALVDNLGRFLRGETDPKTTGALTYKL
jgi:hypothetical protein